MSWNHRELLSTLFYEHAKFYLYNTLGVVITETLLKYIIMFVTIVLNIELLDFKL